MNFLTASLVWKCETFKNNKEQDTIPLENLTTEILQIDYVIIHHNELISLWVTNLKLFLLLLFARCEGMLLN